MIKKLCAASVVLAAATGITLLSAPAHADSWDHNRGWNHGTSQSGNNFGNLWAANRGGHRSTNVNNVNGYATTASNGSIAVTYIFW